GGLFSSLYMDPFYNNYYYGNFGSPWGWGSGFGSGFGFGWPWFGLGFGFGFNGFCPWCFHNRGFCNPLWNHYCWLNRANPHWSQNVHNTFAGQALGVKNAGVVQGARLGQTGVAGAVNNTVRNAAANASRPAVPTASSPLVQPAAQAAKSIA